MYVFTRHGLIAVAHYKAEKQNAPGWMEDRERIRLHNLAVAGADHILVVRGWHRDAIRMVLSDDQQVFVDLKADYPFRGLITSKDFTRLITDEINSIDYFSLKADVINDVEYYSGLAAVHSEAKQQFDPRFPAMEDPWYGSTQDWFDWDGTWHSTRDRRDDNDNDQSWVVGLDKIVNVEDA
jgi:hypothetical protein